MEEKKYKVILASIICVSATAGLSAGILFYFRNTFYAGNIFGDSFAKMINLIGRSTLPDMKGFLCRTFIEYTVPALIIYLSAYTLFCIPASVSVLTFECMRFSYFLCSIYFESQSVKTAHFVLFFTAAVNLTQTVILCAFVFESIIFRKMIRPVVSVRAADGSFDLSIRFTEKFLFICGLTAVQMMAFILIIKMLF